MGKHTVVIEGHGTFLAEEGEVLLDLCEREGVPMGTDCGGFSACAACRVEVLDDGSGLSPCLDEEEPFLETDQQRLGCQAAVQGPVHVRLDPGL